MPTIVADLERLPGCCGIKVFLGSSTGTLLIPDDATLKRLLAHGTRRVAIHSEDEYRAQGTRRASASRAIPRPTRSGATRTRRSGDQTAI